MADDRLDISKMLWCRYACGCVRYYQPGEVPQKCETCQAPLDPIAQLPKEAIKRS